MILNLVGYINLRFREERLLQYEYCTCDKIDSLKEPSWQGFQLKAFKFSNTKVLDYRMLVVLYTRCP